MSFNQKIFNELRETGHNLVKNHKQTKKGLSNNDHLIEFGPLKLDFSRQFIDFNTISKLFSLKQFVNIRTQIKDLYLGNKEAIHTMFRYKTEERDRNPIKAIGEQKQKMYEFCDRVNNGSLKGWGGTSISSVIFLGLGGSILPQKFASHALTKDFKDSALNFGFFSNPDGLELKNYLKNCDPKKTFFVLQSKSFKTPELLFLANHAESWLKSNGCPSKRLLEFFAVVTSNKQAALDKGYLESYIFEIPKELGGRFSIWSTMGLSIALLIGKAQFENFLQGGRQADMHFLKTNIKKNIPMILAGISIWNRSFLNYSSLLVLNYSSLLDQLTPYLQQMEMESLGKPSAKDYYPDQSTCGVVWGGNGFDGQHAYFQFLHQGSAITPIDIFEVEKDHTSSPNLKKFMEENIRAQADSLFLGKTSDGFLGKRPSSIITLEEITPRNLGLLMAIIEHKIFTESIYWGVNPFDQPGVELSKNLLQARMPDLS